MENIKFDGVKIEVEQDPRDYAISRFIPGQDEIKDEEFILPLPELDIIINQTRYSACVGHSFATAKSILEYIRTNKWIDFDPFAIYGTRYPGEYDGVGMYTKQAAKVIHTEGAFLRRDFGIQQEMPMLAATLQEWKKNNPDKVEDAKNYCITGYSNVRTVQDFKTALKNLMPISVTFPIYNSFYKVDKSGILSNPNKNENIKGYHQMTVVGWTKNDYWIVINSWGINYGLKGLYFIPFDYPFNNAVSISDTITPSKYKAKKIEMFINKKRYLVDGVAKEFDSVPILRKDRTYIPVRFVSEALGASVEWIENTQQVIIRSEEAIIEMTIDSKEIKVNNKKKTIDAEPIVVDDRTLLPVRFIAEALNCKVSWDGIDEKITISAL